MTFWLQHGQGKSDKIAELAAAGSLDGVILSPAHEDATGLRRTAREIRALGLPVVLDPQTYVHSIPGGSARWHHAHGLEFPTIHWSIDPASIEQQVRAVIAANDAVGVDGPIIAPTVLQRGFRDAWTVSAFQYARVTERLARGREVLASLVVEDGALGDWEPLEEWLDVATTLDVAGFYIVVSREAATYPSAWDAQRVANLMRLIHRLSVLNGYAVLLGYADHDGLGAIAAGATGLGSGWHYSLRVFRSSRWVPGGFGRTPIPRVTSRGLMTPIAVRGEGELIARSAHGPAVLPDAAVRSMIASHPARWTNVQAHVQHLTELSAAARALDPLTAPERLDRLQADINDARALLDAVLRSSIQLHPSYRPRLAAMASAVTLFRTAERL